MNDISERDGKWYIVDDAGKVVSDGYTTQREAEALVRGKPLKFESDGERGKWDITMPKVTGAPIAEAAPAPIVTIAPAAPAPSAPIAEAKPKKSRALIFSEAVSIAESSNIDRKAGTLDVTLIRPGWSANNRYYSPQMLESKVGMWDGVRAYGNHASVTEAKERPEGDIFNQIGYYTAPRWEDGKTKATLKLIGDEAKKQHILDWAEESIRVGKPLMGLSINAAGKTKEGEAEGRKGIIVEDIARAFSVDVVTTPAAGGQFERLLASNDEYTDALIAAMDYDEWASVKPEFVQRLRESMKALRQDEAIRESQSQLTALREANAALTARNTQLETQLTEASKAVADMRAEQARRVAGLYADQLLKESHLPTAWQTTLQPQLLAEANTGIWAGLIERERVKYASVRTSIPVQVNGAITRAGAHSVVSESDVPLPGERAEAYGRRMGYLR